MSSTESNGGIVPEEQLAAAQERERKLREALGACARLARAGLSIFDAVGFTLREAELRDIKATLVVTAEDAEAALADTSAAKPVIIAADTDADAMNTLHGESYGVDWAYPVKEGSASASQEPYK